MFNFVSHNETETKEIALKLASKLENKENFQYQLPQIKSLNLESGYLFAKLPM